MTQGDPLAVVARGIGIIPLIKFLNYTYPVAMQPWCAYNAGALGMFDKLERYFNWLKHNVPDQGYYPDPTKIILVVHPQNLKAGELFVQFNLFKVCIDARYLGGYIVYDISKGDSLKNWTGKLERYIHALSKTVDKYPQESYAAVVRVVQLEWVFLQRVTKDTG